MLKARRQARFLNRETQASRPSSRPSASRQGRCGRLSRGVEPRNFASARTHPGASCVLGSSKEPESSWPVVEPSVTRRGHMDSEPADARAGRLARMASVYEVYAPGAFRLAAVMVGDPEVARDITQDAFLRVFSRFRDLRQTHDLPAYLRRVVINLCRDHFRRSRTDRVRLERHAASSPPPISSPPDVGTHQALIEGLRKLPDRQQAALVLRYFEDLSYDQIADTLRCSPSAAKNLIHRGMVGLREELGGVTWD